MRAMVEEFHRHIETSEVAEEILASFGTKLERPDYDMEDLIEHVERVENGQASQRDLGLRPDESLLRACRTMRWEAEWFVQHVCSRFRQVDAKVLWGPALRNLGDHELCVATTNYDRLLEVACEAWSLPFDDGFEEFDGREAAKWTGIQDPRPGRLSLLKIHGSTDWYKADDECAYKLRHSMPLYGELSLDLESRGESSRKMRSAFILPTREKIANEPPYPDLTTSLRNRAGEADVALFLGTSLRDPHILDILRKCTDRAPTYLVNRRGTVNVDVPDLQVIRSTASGFLTSTLPKFLCQGDRGYLDACADGRVRTTGEKSLLEPLVAALDGGADVDRVCKAIDVLVEFGAALDTYDVRRLLRRDDLTVRKYALALIPEAVDVSEAMAAAERRASQEGEGAFTRELERLIELMPGLAGSIGR